MPSTRTTIVQTNYQQPEMEQRDVTNVLASSEHVNNFDLMSELHRILVVQTVLLREREKRD